MQTSSPRIFQGRIDEVENWLAHRLSSPRLPEFPRDSERCQVDELAPELLSQLRTLTGRTGDGSLRARLPILRAQSTEPISCTWYILT